MPFRNTREEFGAALKALHWTIVLLMILAYATIYYTGWAFPRATPPWRFWLHVHQVSGWAILFLAAAMLLWSFANVRPPPERLNGWEVVAAKLAHALVYILLIAMPLTGYLGGDRPRSYFGLITLASFRDTAGFAWLAQTFGVTWPAFNDAMDEFHHLVGRIGFPLLLALHVGAALMHHLHRRDRVLSRMLPRAFSRPPRPAE